MTTAYKLTASVVTVVYNNADTIGDTIRAVLDQTHPNIEYVIIDGGSDDGTQEIVEGFGDKIDYFVSEPDEGIYDAMNKGIRAATGDVVHILNSDDFYADSTVVERMMNVFEQRDVDCVHGDVAYVDWDDTDRVIRYWRAGDFTPRKFRWGWMPPHQSFFVRRELYEKYGVFDQDLDISADYELILRFLYHHDVKSAYVPALVTKARVGGHSNESLMQRLKGHLQCHRAWLMNGKLPNPVTLAMKPLSKLPQYFAKPERV